MSGVRFSPEYRIEPLRRDHPRSAFHSGQAQVDDWLSNKALQNQKKHLSATKVLIDSTGAIAGFYTLATAQVDFADLPPELCRNLPRRTLPVAVLAWLGVREADQGHGHGRRLLAQALKDSYDAGKIFPFVALIIDCLDDKTLGFYRRWDFKPLPGHDYRLYLSWNQLAAMATRC